MKKTPTVFITYLRNEIRIATYSETGITDIYGSDS